MVALIDTHTHLFAEEFDEDRELAIIRATEAGVTRLFMPNIDDTSVEKQRWTSYDDRGSKSERDSFDSKFYQNITQNSTS